MKTKHILTALALPALFAACTADEFEGVNALQQSERAKLSKDFVLTTNSEVESRLAVEGTTGLDFSWEEGDLIGANIIDTYVPVNDGVWDKDDPTTWDIVYSVSPSLPFKNTGLDKWTTERELGVGNYLFTYPYNSKDNNRAAAIYELPAIQDLSEGDLNAAIKAGDKAVGATVLTEGKTMANVSMKHLFTYPKFVIKFDNGENVTEVTKVALQGNFVVKAGYNHKKVAALFADDYAKFAALTSAARANLLWEVEADETYDADIHTLNWKLVQTSDFLIQATDADYSEAEIFGKPETAEFLVAELNQQVTEDASGNKKAEVRFMMPSVEDFTTTDITLYAYTDNGVYKRKLNSEQCEFKSTTTAAAKRTALHRSKTNTLNVKQLAPATDESNNIVTSIEDWNLLVAKYGSNKDSKVDVAVIGSSFSFNEEAVMPTEATFKVNTDVTVEGEVTLNKLTIAGDITVEKDATLNIGKDLKANKVINKGTVIVAEKANVTGIDNEGTLTVKNNGKLIAQKEAESRAAEAVVINNKGVMTVEEGGDVKSNVNNYATLNINGYVNSTVVNGKDGAKKEENAKAIITMGATTKAILKGTVTNYGKITTAKGATVVVTTNYNEVEFVDGTDLTCTNGTNGEVSYKSAEASFSNYYFKDANGKATAKAAVTKLVLTKSATFAGTATGKIVDFSAKTIELEEGADITVTDGHTLKIGTLIVKGKSAIAKTGSIVVGTLTVKEEADLSTNTTITATKVDVEEDAYLTIGKALTTGTFVNNGSVTNNASVSVDYNGLTGEGSWTGDEVNVGDSANQVSLDEALEALVIAWIDNSGHCTSWTSATVAKMKNQNWAGSTTWVKENAKAVVDAYNTNEGLTGDDKKTVTKDNVNAILDEYATDIAAYVTAYKTTASTTVTTALTNRVDVTDSENYYYSQKINKDWISGSEGYLTALVSASEIDAVVTLKQGIAYMGTTKGALDADYKALWKCYITAVINEMAGWTEDDATTTTVDHVYSFQNESGNLKKSLKFTLESIYADLDAMDDDDATVAANVNPSLAIPSGSFIDASSKTGNNYKVIKAWMDNKAFNPKDSSDASLNINYKGSSNLTNVSLENIQNWYIKAAAIETPADMTEQNAKTAATNYKDIVVLWKNAPIYTDNNLIALVKKLAE